MKKIKKVITGLICLSLVFLLLPTQKTKAAPPGAIDQSCAAVVGNISILRSGGVKHYFKPSMNHITIVSASITSDGTGNKWNFTLRDNNDDVLATEQKTNDWAGRVTHYMGGFDAEVTPGIYYSIHLEPDSGHTKWYYTSNVDCDPNGFAYYDGSPQSKDMDFMTWGYNEASPQPDDDDPIPPGDDSTPSNDEAPPSTDIEIPSQSAEEAKVEEDPSIESPILNYIEKNNEKTDAPIDEVEIKEGDKLKLVGTSFKEARVVIFIGELAYYAYVDEDGSWSIDLPVLDFDAGLYTVQAQAQTDDKGSEIVDLFVLKRVVEREKVEPPEQHKLSLLGMLSGPYFWYTPGVLLALLVALLAVLIALIKMRKQGKKGEKTGSARDLETKGPKVILTDTKKQKIKGKPKNKS